MQIAADATTSPSIPSTTLRAVAVTVPSPFSQYKLIRRNGAVVGFEPGKISVAMTKAFWRSKAGRARLRRGSASSSWR